jgi:hypothetical protein
MSRFLRSQFGIFLYGFVFWLPIALIIFILVYIYRYGENIGSWLFQHIIPSQFYHQGYGFILGIIIIYLSGALLKMNWIRSRLSKIPILGLFFGGGEVMTVDRLANLTPCLFMMSPTCLSYGWILSEERVQLENSETTFSLLNVYYPNVPTLITGQVFPIRKDSVIKLGNPSKEIIDLLLYAFRSPNSIQYMPWEGESIADFTLRAKAFGINIIPADWNHESSIPIQIRPGQLPKK